MVKIHPEY
jgi:spore coat protein CotH